MTLALKRILLRFLDKESKSYACMFSCDDKKKDPSKRTRFFEVSEENIDKIVKEFYFYNIGTHATYFNVNPFDSKNRGNDYVKKIKFIFIDIDEGATESEYETLKQFLEVKGFKIFYSCKSGSGYHILLNVDLPTEDQPKVKSFVNYLNTNICPKVDVRTTDLARICRVPESEHHKREPFRLKTLIINEDKEEDVKTNNELYKEFQCEEKREEISIQYQESLDREDIFFSTILNSQDKWQNYFKELNEHDKNGDGKGNNLVFNKNLALFCYRNTKYLELASQFMKAWNNPYVTHQRFEYFYKKVRNDVLKDEFGNPTEKKVSYFELKGWAKDSNLKLFYSLLKEQTKFCYLDNFEVYYLEEEKKDLAYLLYFPSSNYYVQKSLPEVLMNIYRKAIEEGVDFEKQYNLKDFIKDWENLSFKDKQKTIIGYIGSHLERENRIKLVYNINYAPINQKFVNFDNKKFFNIYKKTNLMQINNNKINEYDFRHIKDLIMNLCEKNEENYTWFISWLAYQVQFPNRKLPTAVIFQGEQGTGKGVLKTHILDPMFGNNCQEINQTHLESQFNEYLLGKQIIVANEVMHNENRLTLPNILKNLVTDEYITIQRKFRKDLVIRNYTHWIFCTNSDNPLKIEEGDRRYSVFKSKKLHGGGRKAQEFVTSLVDNKEHELSHFLAYLKKLEVDYYLVANPKMTQAKEDIVDLNRDSVERFAEYLKRFKDYFSAHLEIFTTDKEYKKIVSDEGYEYLPTEVVYLLYHEWGKKFGERGLFNKQNFSRKITKFGINNVIKKHEGKSLRAYPVEMLDNFVCRPEE